MKGECSEQDSGMCRGMRAHVSVCPPSVYPPPTPFLPSRRIVKINVAVRDCVFSGGHTAAVCILSSVTAGENPRVPSGPWKHL